MDFLISISRFVSTRPWLRRSLRYRIFDFFRIDYQFDREYYGLRWSGNLNNFIDRSVFFFGAHEREYLEFSSKFLNSQSVVIDAGANVGNHSLYYSTIAKEVYSFEPNPETFLRLTEHKVRNSIEKLKPINSALVMQDGEYEYFKPTGDNLGIGSLIFNFSSMNSKEPILVQHTVGDIFVQENLTTLDFIKCDTEGFDSDVLFGLAGSISKHKPIIQLEYSREYFQDWDIFVRDIVRDYRIYSMVCNRPYFIFNRPKVILVPFDRSKVRSEILMIPEFKFQMLGLEQYLVS